MDRLFVPLSSEPFEDFINNGKQYEIRAHARNFSNKFVYTGRDVELRKGYSGSSIWGTIGDVFVDTLDSIMDNVDYRLIEPRAQSRKDAIRENIEQIGLHDEYIAFQIIM
ncbi:hypothetical protein GOV11_03905 [Candidatus Woesearchaeota archaeon]|nr:hypothetical protein [Candidatus Woesearchaeota archaeon]